MRGRRKRIALLTSLLCALLVAALIGFSGPLLLESWHLHRLDSTDDAVRWNAAESLADLQSARAVPHLIKIIDADTRELCRDGGATPIVHAVYSIAAATPAGRRQVEDAVRVEIPLGKKRLLSQLVRVLGALESGTNLLPVAVSVDADRKDGPPRAPRPRASTPMPRPLSRSAAR